MKIETNVPNGKCGNWEVGDFIITENDVRFFNMRAMFRPGTRTVTPGAYKRLTMNGAVIMSNTPSEIMDHIGFINKAKKSKTILINGLGLGVALSEIIKSDIPENITVVEISQDVIKLVASSFKDKRINIINCDAFEYGIPKNSRYDVVWHDIWNDICTDNLKGMTKLHRKYGKKCDWQDSWCKMLCKRYKRMRY